MGSGLLTTGIELNLQRQDLEEQWLARADHLTCLDLKTEVFSDLHLALEAAKDGRKALVIRWLDHTEARFISIWEQYESGDVLEEEVTVESVLGHRFLLEGVEGWLDALGTFREELEIGEVNADDILECAEYAQRRLVLLQLLEQEAEEALQRYFACYN